MADNNVGGHVDAVLAVCRGPEWGEVWAAMDVEVQDFERLGVPRDLPDAELWHVCQERNILLITANRNSTGPDSLEATIRGRGTADSLPVLTLADPDRVLGDGAYVSRVAERLIDICLDVDRVRGTGRLYLPATGG